MLSNDLDDISRYLRYRLENEAQSHFLVVVLEREKRRLVFQLYIVVLISVHFLSDEVESVKHLLRPEHP